MAERRRRAQVKGCQEMAVASASAVQVLNTSLLHFGDLGSTGPHPLAPDEGFPCRTKPVTPPPQLAVVWPGRDTFVQHPLGGCLSPHMAGEGLLHPTGCLANPHSPQASQLGVYKAFVDNYKIALETAEKCSQSNYQFQKISEVSWAGAVLGEVGRECCPHGRADHFCPLEIMSLPWGL